jgi:hypothetical protein
VPEAALPFWIVFGAVAGAGTGQTTASPRLRAAAAVVLVVVGIGLAGAARAYARPSSAAREQGFHGSETAADGSSFRWMTRHGITYIPDGPGFLRLRLQAPGEGSRRAYMVETAVAGRVLDRREIPAGTWITYDIPVRRPGPAPRRRVDLRVNQMRMEDVALGRRTAQRPITVMVGDIRWMPIR